VVRGFASAARNQDILPGNVLAWRRVRGLCATDAGGWDILPGSALRSLTGEKMRLPATSAVGWDTLPGSALMCTGMMVGRRIESTEEVEVLNATSATGLDISPVSATRKRIAATGAMALDTSRGIAARKKTPATIVMRSAIS